MGDRGLGETRQTTTPPTTTELGLLGADGDDYRIDRVPVATDLAGLAERYWLVSWDLPAGASTTVQMLPHPCVNLVFDRGAVMIAGVGRERFGYRISGSGQVFGVKFRPGGFYPLFGRPVTELTDAYLPLAAVWGADDAAAMARDLSAAGGDLDLLARAAEIHLRAHWPRPPVDPEVEAVGQIIRALLYDRRITRVDDVSALYGGSSRTLQRLFRRYVGVSPKWVLRRYRLHVAAARLAEEGAHRWAEVAADLGYFDQSHYIRDFTAAIGMTPSAYAEACRARRAPVAA